MQHRNRVERCYPPFFPSLCEYPASLTRAPHAQQWRKVGVGGAVGRKRWMHGRRVPLSWDVSEGMDTRK